MTQAAEKFLSEKTARAIDRYIHKLVKRQPEWLRLLFDSEQIVFIMDENGALALNVDESLDFSKKIQAQRLISQYMTKNPSPAIKTIKVH